MLSFCVPRPMVIMVWKPCWCYQLAQYRRTFVISSPCLRWRTVDTCPFCGADWSGSRISRPQLALQERTRPFFVMCNPKRQMNSRRKKKHSNWLHSERNGSQKTCVSTPHHRKGDEETERGVYNFYALWILIVISVSGALRWRRIVSAPTLKRGDTMEGMVLWR